MPLHEIITAAKTVSRQGVFPLDDWNDVISALYAIVLIAEAGWRLLG